MISDNEVEDFIEHFGKKGMKWGVRQQRRLTDARSVASGKASREQKMMVLGRQSIISLIRGRGLQGAAARDVMKLEAAKKRIKTGKATSRDYLNRHGALTIGAIS